MCDKEDEMMNVVEQEPRKLKSVLQMREIAQKAMKKKGLTEKDLRKSLKNKRYEK